MDLTIRGGRVFTPGGWCDTDVAIEGSRIVSLRAPGSAAVGPILDATGCSVVPGFLDVHIHGAGGAMCEDADPAGLRRISETLATYGVTGFLATIAALPHEPLCAAVANVVAVAGTETGARILGIHLEGPYLNPRRAGAQPRSAFREPSLSELDELQHLAGGRIRLITLAPELDGAEEFVKGCRERGIVVSLGHTDATAECTRRAIEGGAQHMTHLFNAMRELHHREPGPIGVGLTDDRVSVELICDGHHVDPSVVDLVFRSKPPGKVVLVSDAVGALGLPEGAYEMFGVTCLVTGGAIRLEATGQLAGSCLSLDRAIRNLRAWLPTRRIDDWLTAASEAPAALLGEHQRGRIAEGAIADLALLDGDWKPRATIVGGTIVAGA